MNQRGGTTLTVRIIVVIGVVPPRWFIMAFNHTTVGMVECHDEPAWWYDSDGPYYSCDWYRQDSRRCEWYGDWYRNFGKTANEACCGCRHEFGNVRRKLEEIEGEDHVPKRGFLFTNEIASGFNVESSEMIAMEGVTSTSSQCQERSW